MGRERKGSIKVVEGKIYARVSWIDETGKKKEVTRRAANRTEAHAIKRQLIQEIAEHGTDILKGDTMTFAQLADFYKANYLVEAKYVDDRKVAGLRSKRQVEGQLTNLLAHFDQQKIKTIKPLDIEKYKNKRLDKKLSIAYVNRELALIRRMLNIAQQQGWISKNPFNMATGLISAADEKKRDRILSRDEELALLEVCIGKRLHLKAVIICAVDTGMRQGEIFKLCWKDVNFVQEQIIVQAFNTKTMKERLVPITTRLKTELLALTRNTIDPQTRVFQVATNCKKSFAKACELANIDDLRFHDLRHTAATRMIQGGLPLQEVGRILGHTQANTTYRYVNANADTARRAALALEAFWEEKESKEEKQEKEKSWTN